jgi:hypothetical protein
MPRREIGSAGLKNHVLKYCRSRGGWWQARPASPWGHSGFPDILGCWHGIFIGLEVKMPGKDARPDQVLTLAEINIKGHGCVSVITSVTGAKFFLDALAMEYDLDE